MKATKPEPPSGLARGRWAAWPVPFHRMASPLSPLRVIRRLAIMTVGGNAFDEEINESNRSLNREYGLSRWFTAEFGSTQREAITHRGSSDPMGVDSYTEGDCITKCMRIADKPAVRVQTMIPTI